VSRAVFPGLLLTGLFLALGAACSPSGEEWEGHPTPCPGEDKSTCRMEMLQVDGEEREYLLALPESLSCDDGPFPLILVWHGSGTNGQYIRQRTTLETLTAGQALMVYPQGLPRPELDGRTGWNRDPLGNDLRYFDALPTHLAQTHCVDPTRVFSVGHSRGGRFVDVLGCHRGAAHLALASISAGTGNVDSCPQSAPMWITHGRQDEYVWFWEGEDYRNRWAEKNGCRVPGFFDSFPDDVCTELSQCPEDSPVVWCPHTEEGDSGHGPPTFAGDEIWRFFQEALDRN
jgi:polyhydroxybutyrate depolymerase